MAGAPTRAVTLALALAMALAARKAKWEAAPARRWAAQPSFGSAASSTIFRRATAWKCAMSTMPTTAKTWKVWKMERAWAWPATQVDNVCLLIAELTWTC